MELKQTKRCRECAEDLPLNANYYDRDRSTVDGFRSTCKYCRHEQNKKQEEIAIDQRVAEIKEQGYNLLTKMAAAGGSDLPHMAEIFQYLMRAFDGPAGYSRMFLMDYLESKPGSAVRQKYHGQLLTLAKAVSESGAAQKSFEAMTDEELDAEIQKGVCKILKIEMKEDEQTGEDSESGAA